MNKFLQNEHFLKDFHLRKIVLHVDLIDAFNRYHFVGKYFLSEVDFTEATLS